MSTALPNFDQFWDYRNPEATEKKFWEIWPLAEARGDTAYQAELLTQIARTHSLRSRFDEAHAILDRVEPLLTDRMLRARIRYLLERGRTFNSANERAKARIFFVKAFELGQKADEDVLAVDAAHMMSIAAETPEAQLNWNLKAMSAAENARDDRAKGWLGTLYNNIGWTYHDMGEFEKALDFFEKARDWRQAAGHVIETRIARWTVARCLRSLEQVEKALAMQLAVLKEWQDAGEDDGYVHEEIGECLLLLDRAEEAPPYFARAYELLAQDPWLADNEPVRLARLKELGQVK